MKIEELNGSELFFAGRVMTKLVEITKEQKKTNKDYEKAFDYLLSKFDEINTEIEKEIYLEFKEAIDNLKKNFEEWCIIDLYNELESKIQELEISIRSLRKTGQKYAEAERDYKILLRQEVLKLRDEGQAIGVITLTCYGIPSVAEARFKRDTAEAIYKANLEAISTIKLQIRVLENQINREFGMEGNRL